jgi:hypothetical protein
MRRPNSGHGVPRSWLVLMANAKLWSMATDAPTQAPTTACMLTTSSRSAMVAPDLISLMVNAFAIPIMKSNRLQLELKGSKH